MPKNPPSTSQWIPQEDELYEASQSVPKRLPGSTVGVSAVHAPVEQEPNKPIRPLFARRPVGKGTPRAPMRLGQRERIVAGILTLILVLVAGLAAVIFLPKADIVLSLRTAPLLVDERITVRADGQGQPGVVSGTAFFREVPVSGTVRVRGVEVVGTTATGTVEIVNRTLEEQSIRERSRLVTDDGALFYMQRHAVIPPDGRVSVPVEAAEEGEAGNIAPQRLNFAALDSSAQSVLYAEFSQALAGGAGEEVHVVSERDFEEIHLAADAEARGQVESEIRAELPEGWIILEESWTTEMADIQYGGEIGDRQNELDYTARAVVRVLGYEEEQMEQLLRAALERRLDEGFELFPGPISFSKSVENVDWERAEGTVSARVTHTTIPDLSLPTLKQKVARRSETEARDYLQGLPGVQSVSIDLWPFWVINVPRIESRIKLDLRPERQP